MLRYSADRSSCALAKLRAVVGAAFFWWVAGLIAPQAHAEIDLPTSDPNAPIVFDASHAYRWQQGTHDVWVLQGNCRVSQGKTNVRSDAAVLWVKREGEIGELTTHVAAYFDGQVTIDCNGVTGPANAQTSPKTTQADGWQTEFFSFAPTDVRVLRTGGEPTPKPAVYERALARHEQKIQPAVRPAQFNVPVNQDPIGAVPPTDPLPENSRRVRLFPRSAALFDSDITQEPSGGSVIVAKGGVNVIVDGLPDFGSIDLSADRIVVWTAGLDQLAAGNQFLQASNVPLEIYMEGNIEFRQGNRVIYADRMYYNVPQQVGTVLNAEMLTPVPQYAGLLRLKAGIVRQTSRDTFYAENTFVTSSRLSRPGYRLQSGGMLLEDQQRPVIDPFTGAPQTLDGEPVIDHQRRLTSNNNFVFLGDVPVFYWPTISTNLEDPGFFLRRVRVRNDNIFGTQILADWDTFQLLGMDKPDGTDWIISTDYLSKRGPAGGTTFRYNRNDLFGIPGPYSGFADAWGIFDDGLDNLGSDRRAFPAEPDVDFRYRVLARHRHDLPRDWRLSGEFGLVSDRNFLESYYEREWEQNKDYITGLELKQTFDNISWGVTADVRVNEFFTQTEAFPRLDHFWLGQSLLNDWLSWYEHSQAGFLKMRTAATPTFPEDAAKFTLFPWEATVSGGRFATRQSLELPVAAGPVKVVPYALGEIAHWGEDITGDDLTRLYGQTGLRASLPVWAADSTIESGLFNVHGLAHKMVFDVEASYADANQDLTQLPLYDPLEDDNFEQFRRRFTFNTFGGVLPDAYSAVPQRFDPRFYALRTGIAGNVTSQTTEIADDLTAVRFGLRQRWQTKRGKPGERRIIDWMVFDTEAVWFPDPVRDNFGADIGLINYDYRWHIGDRLTLLSDGAFDTFGSGLRTVSVGGFLTRPPRGSLYLGFRSINGPDIAGVLTPVNSQVVVGSYSYRMSPKWISSAGVMADVAGSGNVAEQIALTRVGESLLVSLSLNADRSKDNIGVNLLVEPRFLPKGQLGRIGGAQIPPAGLYGLE